MGLTKANILIFVNAQLKRAETNIDIEIQTVLNELSDDENDLLIGTDEDQSLAAGGTSINYPTLYKRLVSIVLNDGSVDGSPLEAIPGGHYEYLQWMEGLGTSGRSEPEWFDEFNSKFFVWRPSNGAYTAKIKFYKYHAQNVGAIEFGDEFKNVINFGSAYYVALKRGLSRYKAIWEPKYYQALQKRVDSAPMQPTIVR